MARRRRNRSNLNSSIQRDDFSPSLATLLNVLNRLHPIVPSAVLQSEDRRQFHPLRRFRPALGLSRLATRLRPAKRSFERQLRMRFSVPDHVAVCVRRKQRREVIFAERKSGAGAKSRRRNRNYLSEVVCR